VTASSCLSTQECLTYVAGASTALQATRVLDHLGRCTGCRTAVAEAAREHFDESGAPPSTRTLAVGEKLLERYEIRRFIAQGGMGEVYEAFDSVLGEAVALKTLTLTSADQSSAALRFLDEVRLARKVTHPSVCRILEFGTHRCAADGGLVPFLTMELLNGETLGRTLAKRGPFDLAVTRSILRDIVDGLAAVHAAGIVHRDLKSENVFLVSAAKGPPRAIVMDFGLAKAEQPGLASMASISRALVGTLDYISPEQIRGRPATVASDVYAFGVVAFEALTGRLPFAGDTPFERSALRLVAEAPSPASVVPGLSASWNDLVRRCLAKEPSRRPASLAEVAQALDRLGGVHEGRRRLPKRAAVTAALLAGAAVVVGALVPRAQPPAAAGVSTNGRPTVVTSVEPPKPSEPLPAREERPRAAQPTVRPTAKRRPRPVEAPPAPERPAPAPPSPEVSAAANDPFAPAKPRPPHPDDLINPYSR
jgi:tRNA A-37 threonylcarbamoyl transferase component Bud32